MLADHGTERNRPPYCGRVPVSRRHGAPLRLAVCVERTEQWPATADRTRFAAVGAGRFRPAIGPPQSATAQTAVPRRWRAAAATADPACNVIRAQPAARRRTRAPASRSAIKRTIGSGCATSIAAASVIGSLIGHSARGGSTTTTEKFRQRLPRSGTLRTHVARAAGRTRSLGRAAVGRSMSVPIGFGLLRGHRHRREMRCARDQDWSSSSKV